MNYPSLAAASGLNFGRIVDLFAAVVKFQNCGELATGRPHSVKFLSSAGMSHAKDKNATMDR